MTNPDYTHITLLADRSGSMQIIQADAEGAINSFITEQAKLPGKATLTLVQFDTAHETVVDRRALAEVPPYRLVPRGSTALRDAWGYSMGATGEWLASLPEDQRPGNVAFVVVTDGQENSSREFTETQIAEWTKRQQEDYGWKFLFLAANQDAVAQGIKYGLGRGSTLTYAHTGAGTQSAYSSTSSVVAGLRSTGQFDGFSEADRQAADPGSK